MKKHEIGREVNEMKQTAELKELKRAQKTVDRLRSRLGISAPGEIVFCSDLDAMSYKEVVVVADGLGGAKLLVVEGNYPIDYSFFKEQSYSSEARACEEAERLVS